MATVILLIEDDVLVSRMYQKVFSFENIEVKVAPDGLIGLQMAQELRPALVVCDVMMPKMNGLEVLSKLKADPATANIPVIMLTNLSGTQDAQKALSIGALAYMVKSEYKPREVVSQVKSVLAGAMGSSPAPQATQTQQAQPAEKQATGEGEKG